METVDAIEKLTNYELIATQQLLSIDSAALYIS